MDAVADAALVASMQRSAAAVHVADAVSGYAVPVGATGLAKNATSRSAPRRARAASWCAQRRRARCSTGATSQRPFDVKRIAPDVLRHRIVLSYEAEADGVRPERIVEAVLAAVETP